MKRGSDVYFQSEKKIKQEGKRHELIQDNPLILSSDGQILDQQMILTENVDDSEISHIDEEPSMQLTDDETLNNVEEITDNLQNLIIEHMDISKPLTVLRKLLERRLQTSLLDHEFYLQDTICLDPNKNLVSQCVQGNGIVQINVEVKSNPNCKPRLNIIDILKPASEFIETSPDKKLDKKQQKPIKTRNYSGNTKIVIPLSEENDNVTRWVVDAKFRREQEKMNISHDPSEWTTTHVEFWLNWAVNEFNLTDVNIEEMSQLNGKELCNLSHGEFSKYVLNDKNDMFWTHLELLRKCKFVATVQQPLPNAITTIVVPSTDSRLGSIRNSGKIASQKRIVASPRAHFYMAGGGGERGVPGNKTGNNGQVQLWQFLLELLTDKNCMHLIHWVENDGEFKLVNPEGVANLWGRRKSKPTMNYEKLSRALRYYYDGDMIAKVHGKRFVYKFVCDLRALLGYSAQDLNRLVTECSERSGIYSTSSPSSYDIGLTTSSKYRSISNEDATSAATIVRLLPKGSSKLLR